jgi:hypothetical protein
MPHLLVHNLLPVGLEHPAHQLFIGPKAIQGSGIKQGDARIQRRQQYLATLLGRRWHTVGMAEVHAAKANGRNGKRAKLSLFHGTVLALSNADPA